MAQHRLARCRQLRRANLVLSLVVRRLDRRRPQHLGRAVLLSLRLLERRRPLRPGRPVARLRLLARRRPLRPGRLRPRLPQLPLGGGVGGFDAALAEFAKINGRV